MQREREVQRHGMIGTVAGGVDRRALGTLSSIKGTASKQLQYSCPQFSHLDNGWFLILFCFPNFNDKLLDFICFSHM